MMDPAGHSAVAELLWPAVRFVQVSRLSTAAQHLAGDTAVPADDALDEVAEVP
jgi:hypothetical protein